MKKQIWAGAVAAICGLSISAAAQTAGSQTPQGSRSASDQITVTGCLQRDSGTGTAGATGTTGATGASASAPKFVLNVSPSPSSSPSTAGTSGSSSTASKYQLDADDAKLTPHVGHKVEITGTLDKSTSATATATSPTGTASASAGTPKLKVDSVRMIAASCSE